MTKRIYDGNVSFGQYMAQCQGISLQEWLDQPIEEPKPGMKMQTIVFNTPLRKYIELVAKEERMTLTMFLNDCVRERLLKKTAFLADIYARKATEEEMGLPSIANASLEELQVIMSKEKYSEYLEKWGKHRTRIEYELKGYLGKKV